MVDTKAIATVALPEPPAALRSLNPARWLTIFGPGAIVASLTIGTGELIFSSRGGAIFGYRILFLFLVISVLKWVLLFSAARHIVASGVHPLRRWLDLPIGPRGWLPAVMILLAAFCLPIWVSFHSSVLGELLAELSGTKDWLAGGSMHLWGCTILFAVTVLALRGGYQVLERVQLLVICIMMLAVCVALFLLKPDWFELARGALVPQWLSFPEWLLADQRPTIQKIASQPVWVELSLYVGVIGGAGYDYLAYTAFLREKQWGFAGADVRSQTLDRLTDYDLRQVRQWMRAPMIDCTMSFLAVFIFSAVFVASGWLVLAPQQQIPGDGGFLSHQAQFVTRVHPWLYGLYAAGTFLTLFGTLYGTLELAPAMLRESWQLLSTAKKTTEDLTKAKTKFQQPTLLQNSAPSSNSLNDRAAFETLRLRRFGLLWTALFALGILGASFVFQITSGRDRPPGLTALLVPANLFTGVFSCGIICLLNPWIDRRLPRALQLNWPLKLLNWLAGALFVALGIKGYWDYGGPLALLIMAGTVLAGWIFAWLLRDRLSVTNRVK